MIDEYGNHILSEKELFELIYNENLNNNIVESSDEIINFKNILSEKDEDINIILYNKPNISIDEFHNNRKSEYFIPEKYLSIDLNEYFSKFKNENNSSRIDIELNLVKQFEIENVFKFLIYLKDIMVKKNIVWGIGRGSSVACYLLYCIEIHYIDSIKYNLDPHDFFHF